MKTQEKAKYSLENIIRGNHLYTCFGKQLFLPVNEGNVLNLDDTLVMKDGEAVGHILRINFSAINAFFHITP